MKMTEKVSQLANLSEKIKLGGGPVRIEKPHKSGKLTARERIDFLLDEGSFFEIDLFMGEDNIETLKNPGEGVVTGYGTIDGRVVYLFAQDFTVTGGTLSKHHASKICKVMDMAMKVGAPFIGLNDSGGARIQEGVESLNGYGQIFSRNTKASGVIPQISAIMGPCAGGAVYSPALTDFIFMVDKSSQMFITGPQVVKAVMGEEISAEALGGAQAHSEKSGVCHFMTANDRDCLQTIRKLLSYLPSSNREDPPAIDPVAPPGNPEDLVGILPDNPMVGYDVRDIIRLIVDGGEYFEVQPNFARNLVVGFSRLDGRPVGVVANQPGYMAGCLDINASDKLARFVRLCDCFNIPLLTFMDVPGYLPGSNQEFGGIIRHGAKVLFAYTEAMVPKLTVILRKGYGGAYIAMCGNGMGSDAMYAWPTAEIAVMGPEGAANIIYKKEIESAENPAEMWAQKSAEYRDKFSNPYIAAARGFIDSVIDPRDTRKLLINTLCTLKNKKENRPEKRHGNIPL